MLQSRCFAVLAVVLALAAPTLAGAQEAPTQAAPSAANTVPTTATPTPLSDEEMEVLVARIALYPDELIAVITAASLFPLQIVEAERYLEAYAKDKSLKPKDSWDSSVISLLNYPQVVKMMSDDLEWTQSLGDVLAYQQKDVLIAIQQLREEAVAKGIIKSDDKVKVTSSGDNVVIQAASPEKVYVPQYPPEMLYEPDYVPAPIEYYPDPYPPYWYPTATFFAGAVTGAIWAAVVDWDDWNVWDGRWDGGDVDIDCNHCFNDRDFNGKIDFKDVDWKNIDRSKINIDRDKLQNIDRDKFKNEIKARGDVERVRDRAADIKRERPANLPSRTEQARDIRKSTAEGLKNKDLAASRPKTGQAGDRRQTPEAKQGQIKSAKKNAEARPSGKKKPGQRVDNRPKKPAALGEVKRGKSQKVASQRGGRSMGGGYQGNRGGGGHKQIRRSGGGHGGGPSRGGGGGRRR